ncbi:hypothetical protein HJG60_011327 [Phyllostomus discolor]|uniref:Uncharacterized protein n=1 Tax=Phyllostomus discolor TaxID=89673 RepID=A0A834A4M2_9CHIR|nr:hypothetical protein HJG60_011327 [Phyllostomus discolor]
MPDLKRMEAAGCVSHHDHTPVSRIPSLPNSFVSNWLSTSRTQRGSKFVPMSDDMRNMQLSLPALSAYSSPFRYPSPLSVFRTKTWKTSASWIVSRNIFSRARQISPEEWSQINQTGPERYQAAIPVNIDTSMALGAWVGDPVAAVPITPPPNPPAQGASSPGVLMSMLLVCWYETEGVSVGPSRQRGLPTWQQVALCLESFN